MAANFGQDELSDRICADIRKKKTRFINVLANFCLGQNHQAQTCAGSNLNYLVINELIG